MVYSEIYGYETKFAWIPTKLKSGRYVWMKKIGRRYTISSTLFGGYHLDTEGWELVN